MCTTLLAGKHTQEYEEKGRVGGEVPALSFLPPSSAELQESQKFERGPPSRSL